MSDTDPVPHRMQQYLGVEQCTIPVSNSTPTRQVVIHWSDGLHKPALVFTYFCSTLEGAQLDSRVIYSHGRKTLCFKSARKIFHMVSKPDHTRGKIENGICIYIFSDQYICKKLNISDTQIEWGRMGWRGGGG